MRLLTNQTANGTSDIANFSAPKRCAILVTGTMDTCTVTPQFRRSPAESYTAIGSAITTVGVVELVVPMGGQFTVQVASVGAGTDITVDVNVIKE